MAISAKGDVSWEFLISSPARVDFVRGTLAVWQAQSARSGREMSGQFGSTSMSTTACVIMRCLPWQSTASCGAAMLWWVAASEIERQSSSKRPGGRFRSEEHTSELQSLMRISYAVFCFQKKQ